MTSSSTPSSLVSLVCVEDFAEVRNARVQGIRLGSAYHDGRGFFSANFDGGGWGQGTVIPFERDAIDKLNDICGVEDLFSCTGHLVRLCWWTPLSGCGPAIAAVAHVLDDTKVLVLRERPTEQAR